MQFDRVFHAFIKTRVVKENMTNNQFFQSTLPVPVAAHPQISFPMRATGIVAD